METDGLIVGAGFGGATTAKRSYHLVMVPGLARKARVLTHWTISTAFPRVSQLGALGRPSPLDEP